MTGPDIFQDPLIGGIVMLIVSVIIILFLVRLMPDIFSGSKTIKVLNLLKVLVIFTPLFYAIGSLLNYVSFDLVGWISFEIIMLSVIYFLELIMKWKRWLL